MASENYSLLNDDDKQFLKDLDDYGKLFPWLKYYLFHFGKKSCDKCAKFTQRGK